MLPQLERALGSGAVILDRSHWRVIRLSGVDRLRFLHSQTTNSFVGAPAGAVLDACVLDSQGRTVDLLTAVDVQSVDELVLLASPNRGKRVAAALEKVIFPLDKVRCALEPEGASAVFELLGARAAEATAAALGLSVDALPATDRCVVVGEILVLGSTSLSRVHGRGCILLAPAARAADLWTSLAGTGGVNSPMLGGEAEWQALRVACGRPFPDAELTREINPLEAGLYHTISFSKGCYLGQETVAKVNGAPAPKQRLLGVRLDGPALPGTALFADDDGGARAGVVTSMLSCGTGLVMIRSAVGTAGLRVRSAPDELGVVRRGTALEVPFASRSEAQSAGPREQVGVVAGGGTPAPSAVDAKALAAAADAAAAEGVRKAAKLVEMQARFEAFKAKTAKAGGGPPPAGSS